MWVLIQGHTFPSKRNIKPPQWNSRKCVRLSVFCSPTSTWLWPLGQLYYSSEKFAQLCGSGDQQGFHLARPARACALSSAQHQPRTSSLWGKGRTLTGAPHLYSRCTLWLNILTWTWSFFNMCPSNVNHFDLNFSWLNQTFTKKEEMLKSLFWQKVRRP